MPESNYQSTSKIKIFGGAETTFGTPKSNNAGWYELPVTSYTIPELSAPLEMATARSGHLVAEDTMAQHNYHSKIYTFDLTMKGNRETLIWCVGQLIEDAVSPQKIMGTYVFPDSYKDGEASALPKTFLMQNVGSASSAPDLRLTSCICTSLSMAQALDSENGEMVLTTTWMSAYKPEYIASLALGTPTKYDAQSLNIKNLTTANIFTAQAEDLHLFSWELTLSRSVERIGAIDYNDHKPYGYAMVGQWEVSGSLTCKRDKSISDASAFLTEGQFGVNIGQSGGSGFDIDLRFCKANEFSVDNGSSVLMQTIPFSAYVQDPENAGTTGELFVLTT